MDSQQALLKQQQQSENKKKSTSTSPMSHKIQNEKKLSKSLPKPSKNDDATRQQNSNSQSFLKRPDAKRKAQTHDSRLTNVPPSKRQKTDRNNDNDNNSNNNNNNNNRSNNKVSNKQKGRWKGHGEKRQHDEHQHQQQKRRQNVTTGSYREYYHRRVGGDDEKERENRPNGENDDRLPLIRDVVEKLNHGRDVKILDIGCNDGTLTFEMSKIAQVAEVVGVDIDKDLVKRARRKVRDLTLQKKKESASKNSSSLHSTDNVVETNKSTTNKKNDSKQETITGEPTVDKSTTNPSTDVTMVDIKTNTKTSKMDSKTSKQNPNQKPKSQNLISSEIKSSKTTTTTTNETMNKTSNYTAPVIVNLIDYDEDDKVCSQHPYNIMFRHEDVAVSTNGRTMLEKGKYDLVTCLSVTKWVHLTHGDTGLEQLFMRICDYLNDDGVLILEPQLRRSYKLARQRGDAPKDFDLGKCRLKPDLFGRYLIKECGFSQMQMLRDVRKGHSFNRPVMAFFKRPINTGQVTEKKETANNNNNNNENNENLKDGNLNDKKLTPSNTNDNSKSTLEDQKKMEIVEEIGTETKTNTTRDELNDCPNKSKENRNDKKSDDIIDITND